MRPPSPPETLGEFQRWRTRVPKTKSARGGQSSAETHPSEARVCVPHPATGAEAATGPLMEAVQKSESRGGAGGMEGWLVYDGWK